jgi:hypothetical protein
MAERRAKGLCFKCGGKYHPTQHKCPDASLRLLVLGDGETINEDGEITRLETGDETEDDEPEVECNSMGMLGAMGEYRTMKVVGAIGDVNVLVLIDSGASHNFISPAIVTALGLTMTTAASRNIKLGDGHKVISKGVCEGISLKLGPIEVVINALVLELGGLDVVLGVSWLSTLGKVIMDWKSLSMEFLFQNQLIHLQGQGGKQDQQCFLNTFLGDQSSRRGPGWLWSQKSKEGIST